MAKITKKSDNNLKEGDHFYPKVDTVFVEPLSGILFVSESEDDLSVMSSLEDGYVSCRCAQRGSTDYPNWLSSVKNGSIQVVWCPIFGRIVDNNFYLDCWKQK